VPGTFGGARTVTGTGGPAQTGFKALTVGGAYVHVDVSRSLFSAFSTAAAPAIGAWALEASSGASLTLRSSVVASNAMGTIGGALKASDGVSLFLEASTVYNNTGGDGGLISPLRGAGLFCAGAATTCRVHNSVVWDDNSATSPRVADDGATTPTVTFSDVKGGGGAATSNIEADPGFSGRIFPNFLPGVNLIDKGDPTKDPANPLDFAGNARVQGAAQDIGAFEVDPSTGERCGLHLIILAALVATAMTEGLPLSRFRTCGLRGAL
jgi:hypothetical protein